ncbi:hypothetical protein OSB04_012823 [Centaurea solstitialis]|uniref:Integrase catalytic domain-containing protein n=1 Tax=Centaurea solstitialis TaxID=347529 RepID=A0AA38TC30_9ASTR|nr:hypothetical protein OSB04_012823 [Centaurea solstitialis]
MVARQRKKGKGGGGKAAWVDAESSPIPGLTNEQYQKLVRHFSNEESNATDTTASTANMAGNKSETCDGAYGETPVRIPNGDYILVKGKGTSTLPNGIKIAKVLYIPKFKCNLLSVSRLTKDLRCAVTFFPDFFIAQDLRTRSLIGVGPCDEGLYRMDSVARKALMVTPDVSVWHKRLGHASEAKLRQVDFLADCTFELKKQNFFIKTIECFDLLHCDIWGCYRTPSLSGARYFLTIVDDFSRAVWVFLIKNKYEASSRLMNFCSMIKTQFGKDVKRIRSDNGGEFTSGTVLVKNYTI